MNESETLKLIINTISYGATLLAFTAVGVLLYMVVTELFFGKKKLFNYRETETPARPTWYMPAITAAALWVLNLIFTAFKNSIGDEAGVFPTPTAGPLTLFEKATQTNSGISWIILLISVVFYIATSVMIERISDTHTALLFCLNPVAFFMVVPGVLSIYAFLIVLGYIFFMKRNNGMLHFTVIVFVILHAPFRSTGPIPVVSIEELVMILWLALLLVYSKFGKKKFEAAETVSAIICGIVPAACVLFM